jgi:hypothetical protein
MNWKKNLNTIIISNLKINLTMSIESIRTMSNQMMEYIPSTVTKIMKPIGVFLGTIGFLSFIHWILIRSYANYCAPSGWTGPFVAFISLGSPVCQFINHFQLGIATYYITIWAAAATGCLVWLASQIGTSPVTQSLGINCNSSSKKRSDSNVGAA